MFRIIAWVPADCHPNSLRMHKIPVAAFATTILEPGLFQIGYQLSHFSRHLVSE
jgi:hypothetical protein